MDREEGYCSWQKHPGILKMKQVLTDPATKIYV